MMMLHKRKRSKAMNSDEYATMWVLFTSLCNKYDLSPTLDVCATSKNTKCSNFFTKLDNALEKDWYADVWCNPPHNKKKVKGKWVSQTELFVRKALSEWKKNNINIMMIIPANAVCTKYAEECIEGFAEVHPIYGRPKFEVDGKPTKDSARNSYFCIIWRKRLEYVCNCGGSGCPACK